MSHENMMYLKASGARYLLPAIVAFSLFGLMLAVPAIPTVRAGGDPTVVDCPSASGVLSAATDLTSTNPSYPLSVSYTQSGNLFHYSITTPSTPTSFGVIEICVFPTDASGNPTGAPMPAGTTETTSVTDWTAEPNCGTHILATADCIHGIRNHGFSNIAYGSGTVDALDVTWGTVPGHFLIVLHILDGTICGGGTSNPGTCFVIPNGTPRFPPPPQTTTTTTIASTAAPFTDTATVTASVGTPTGTVAFYFCGPTVTPTSCATSGTPESTVTLVSGSATSTPVTTPTAPGFYCWSAVYTPADTSAFTGSSSTTTTNECFQIQGSSIPQFPFGMLALVAALVPMLLLLRKKSALPLK